MGEHLGLTFSRIVSPAAFVTRSNCVLFRHRPGMQDLNLIPRSFTDFVNLDKLLNIHMLNFSFAQQRENASIFCPFPVFFFLLWGLLLLACMDGIEHHRLLFVVELTAPVTCIIKKNIEYLRDTETSEI